MGLADSGVVGGGAFSLSSSSLNTMVFSTDPSPINKSSNVVGEKRVSMPGLNTASMSNCDFFPSWTLCLRDQILDSC